LPDARPLQPAGVQHIQGEAVPAPAPAAPFSQCMAMRRLVMPASLCFMRIAAAADPATCLPAQMTASSGRARHVDNSFGSTAFGPFSITYGTGQVGHQLHRTHHRHAAREIHWCMQPCMHVPQQSAQPGGRPPGRLPCSCLVSRAQGTARSQSARVEHQAARSPQAPASPGQPRADPERARCCGRWWARWRRTRCPWAPARPSRCRTRALASSSTRPPTSWACRATASSCAPPGRPGSHASRQCVSSARGPR